MIENGFCVNKVSFSFYSAVKKEESTGTVDLDYVLIAKLWTIVCDTL